MRGVVPLKRLRLATGEAVPLDFGAAFIFRASDEKVGAEIDADFLAGFGMDGDALSTDY